MPPLPEFRNVPAHKRVAEVLVKMEAENASDGEADVKTESGAKNNGDDDGENV